jgi:hypothetical protein
MSRIWAMAALLLLVGPFLTVPEDLFGPDASGLASLSMQGLSMHGLAAQTEPELQLSARRLAQAWAGGADGAVVSQLAPARVSLHLEGSVSATLPTRQATAALRSYLRGHHPGEVVVARIALVEGSGDRGFAEFHWTTQRAGTSQSLKRTIFLGFRQEGGSWAVDDVRVIP